MKKTMIEEFEKKDIVIHVQPDTATAVIGLLRSYLENITESLKAAGDEMNVPLAPSFYSDAKELLDEVFEKCSAHSDLKERFEDWKKTMSLTGGKLPGGKSN